jgi:hypothetical protein
MRWKHAEIPHQRAGNQLALDQEYPKKTEAVSLLRASAYDQSVGFCHEFELDTSFLGHIIVMTRPILPESGWQIRICRPAFQDFQRIWRRYYARSVLIRHLLKLRWWDLEDPLLVDLRWNFVRDSNLVEMLVEEEGELYPGMRVLFCDHSPNPSEPTLWVLGGLRIDEEFGDLQRTIYSARRLIVQERAD